MSRPLKREIISQIRELVLCGKTKHNVAKELGIGVSTVYKYTKDIPSIGNDRHFSDNLIQQIREEVLMGKSKYKIAKEHGLKFGAVYYYTKDLPNQIYREEGLTGKLLDMLKELLKEGYIISNNKNVQRLRRLQRYLPMIQRAQIKGGAIYYLSDKNKIALHSLIQHKRSKVFSYQELANISNVFDVKLSKNEKKYILSHKNKDKNVKK